MSSHPLFSAITSFGGHIFGQLDSLFYALIAFVIIDYITGVCAAIRNKRLSSRVGAAGIAKKISIFALVSLSHVIDRLLLGDDDILRAVTTLFYIADEAMSILENVGRVGLPLPSKLREILSHFDKYSGNSGKSG